LQLHNALETELRCQACPSCVAECAAGRIQNRGAATAAATAAAVAADCFEGKEEK